MGFGPDLGSTLAGCQRQVHGRAFLERKTTLVHEIICRKTTRRLCLFLTPLFHRDGKEAQEGSGGRLATKMEPHEERRLPDALPHLPSCAASSCRDGKEVLKDTGAPCLPEQKSLASTWGLRSNPPRMLWPYCPPSDLRTLGPAEY